MEPNTKYIIANIQIPIKVVPNGDYETLMDNLHITFAPTDTLPTTNQSEITDQFQAIIASIFATESASKVVGENITYLLSEIKSKKRGSNLVTTFKRNPGNRRRFTAKRFGAISADTGAGST